MYKFFGLLLTIAVFCASMTPALAFKADTFVPLIHIVDDVNNPLEVPKIVYEESTTSGVFNTWVLTPDALNSATISAFFKKISTNDPRQELGLYLKIKNNVSLQVLNPSEREAVVDGIMDGFFDVFGYYPKTISSSNFDAHSLEYLQKKYSVLGAVVFPDSSQTSPSDNGAYSLTPYFPNKKNHFVPARNFKDRINLSISESVDIENIDLAKELPFYSQKYLNEFTLLNLRSNNGSKTLTRSYYKSLLKTLQSKQGEYNLRFVTHSWFSDWFKARFPESSPASLHKIVNPDKSITYLYQSPWYKLEFQDSVENTKILGFYVYNSESFEPNIATSSLTSNPANKIDNLLDGSVNATLSKTDGPLFSNYLKQSDFWSISFQNNKEKITLQPDKIIFSGLTPPTLNTPLITVNTSENKVTWTPVGYTPFQNHSMLNIVFWIIVGFILFFFKKKDKFPFLGLVLVVITGLTVYRSGALYPFGMGFWGPNGHDAIFHLSVIEKFIKEPFNLSHPQISSEILTNYHFVFAFFSAFIIKLTATPPLFFYFIIFPIFAGLVIVRQLSTLFVGLNLNKFQKSIALILVFLGSSWGYLLRLLQGQGVFGGESAFWANQSVSMFLNPPFVLSIIFLLGFLNIYSKQNKNLKDYLLMVFLGSLLAQTKVYAFILLCLALAMRMEFILLLLVGFGGAILSLPFASVGSIPFVFEPLWFLKSMVQSPDRAYWQRAAEAWQAYEATGSVVKLVVVNTIALVIFVFGNLGLRVLGLYKIISEKVKDNLDGLIRALIFFSILLPLVIVQKVNPWNSIQFLYYGLFFLAIYTAKFFSTNSVIVYVLVLLGTFGSVATIAEYVTPNSSARISYVELEALRVLSVEPKGIVLSPVHPSWTYFSPPQPLYDYVSSSYISAISGQREFLSDTINLEITGIDFRTKANRVNRFYNTTDALWAKDFLQKNSISYIFETPIEKMDFDHSQIPLIKIFSSEEINIYKL